MYDVVIVGAGIAGLTSAIYLVRRELKIVVISKDIGGQMATTAEIENWPGELSINGATLAFKVKEQAEKNGAKFISASVDKIERENGIFKIISSDTVIKAKVVILAYGKFPRKLGIANEKELTGRGVSYCVNCDGQFFKNKDVAVVGGGNSALEAAITMSKIGNKVYLINRAETFHGEKTMLSKVEDSSNTEIIYNDQIIKINGKDKVEGIETANGKKIALSAIFIEIGYQANSSFLNNLVKIDNEDLIIVDNVQQSSTPGIFAAGDITNHPFKQLIIASGQGATAALSAFQYLQKK